MAKRARAAEYDTSDEEDGGTPGFVTLTAVAHSWAGTVTTMMLHGHDERKLARIYYDLDSATPATAEDVAIAFVLAGGWDAHRDGRPLDFTRATPPAARPSQQLTVPAPIEGTRRERARWVALFAGGAVWEALAWALLWGDVGSRLPLPADASSARVWFKRSVVGELAAAATARLAVIALMDGPAVGAAVEAGYLARLNVGGLSLGWPGVALCDLTGLARAAGGAKLRALLRRLFDSRMEAGVPYWAGLPDVVAYEKGEVLDALPGGASAVTAPAADRQRIGVGVAAAAAPRIVFLEAKSHRDVLSTVQIAWLRFARRELGWGAGVLLVRPPTSARGTGGL